jgi:hypothetical protein
LVYLPEDQVASENLNSFIYEYPKIPKDIKGSQTMLGSISDMQSMLLDIENNVPKEESSFQKIEDAKVRENCNSNPTTRFIIFLA